MNDTLLTAQQRLAASRAAIVRDMNGEEPEPESAHPEQTNTGITEAGTDARSSVSWNLVRKVAGSWWQSHPAHLALDVAQPMMRSYARNNPLKLLGIAAATGAGLVVLRPWKLVSLTGVALTLLKSTEVSGVVHSLLRGDHRDDRHR